MEMEKELKAVRFREISNKNQIYVQEIKERIIKKQYYRYLISIFDKIFDAAEKGRYSTCSPYFQEKGNCLEEDLRSLSLKEQELYFANIKGQEIIEEVKNKIIDYLLKLGYSVSTSQYKYLEISWKE